MGKIFNKGLDKDDQKWGLFKRLKNIENAQKNLIKDDDKSIYYTHRWEFEDNDDKNKKQQTNNIDAKPPNMKLKMHIISTMVSFYLLVITNKNLTLTLLGSH